MTVLDTEGAVLFINARAARNLFQCSPEEAVGRNLADAVGESQIAQLLSTYREVLERDRPLTREIPVRLKEGEQWFLNQLYPIRFGEHKIPAVLSISMDITDRKKAEEALIESKRRLQLAHDAAKAGAWEWDLTTGKNVWSEELRKLYQLEPGSLEPSYEAWRESVHPDDREAAEAAVNSAAAQGKELNAEWRLNSRDRVERWFMSRGRPVFDDQGKVVRYLGVVMDITDRKRVEASLRETQERQRAILESVQAGVLVVDAETRMIVDINPAACRIMGLERHQVCGRECHEFICPNERCSCPVLDLGQDLDSSERHVIHASGRPVPVLKTVSRFILHGREHLLESFMDLTERRQSEQFFRTVAEHASDGIYLHGFTPEGLPGRFLDVNPAACEMLGYSRQELLEKSPLDLDAQGLSLENRMAILSELLSKGQTLFQIEHLAKDGRLVPVEIHSKVIDGGKNPLVLSVARDVTARKALEEQMIQAREAAEAANRSKSEFLANMSHELRTPLNGVMGMLQIMCTGPLDDEQRQYAEIAMQSARNMLALINDLLDLSRIEAGKMHIIEESVDIRALMHSVAEFFHLPTRAKGLELKMDVASTAPRIVIGDNQRLRQVLFNLVGNAVKFTESGQISIELACLPNRGGYGSPRLFFSITDSGIGISDDQLDRLFQPFVQADSSFTRRFGGAGLGLSICRRLLSLMGGHLCVDSTPGKGSQFVFILPLKEGKAERRQDAASDHLRPARPLLILLAEDDLTNRMAAKFMLERLGHTVVQAANGQEALQALLDEEFDCALLDIQMPIMSGVEVLKRLRKMEQNTGRVRTPVAAITAYAMESDRIHILEQGCDAFLAKPITMEALSSMLDGMAKRGESGY